MMYVDIPQKRPIELIFALYFISHCRIICTHRGFIWQMDDENHFTRFRINPIYKTSAFSCPPGSIPDISLTVNNRPVLYCIVFIISLRKLSIVMFWIYQIRKESTVKFSQSKQLVSNIIIGWRVSISKLKQK